MSPGRRVCVIIAINCSINRTLSRQIPSKFRVSIAIEIVSLIDIHYFCRIDDIFNRDCLFVDANDGNSYRGIASDELRVGCIKLLNYFSKILKHAILIGQHSHKLKSTTFFIQPTLQM